MSLRLKDGKKADYMGLVIPGAMVDRVYLPEVHSEGRELPLLALVAQETRNFRFRAKEPAILEPRAKTFAIGGCFVKNSMH